MHVHQQRITFGVIRHLKGQINEIEGYINEGVLWGGGGGHISKDIRTFVTSSNP